MSNQAIMDELQGATREHREWASLVSLLDDPAMGVHLAVMLEPFLTFILNRRKTIESRFAKNAVAPYGKVAVGDLVLLKAGPVVGSFRVSSVELVTIGSGDLTRLRQDYAGALCADDDDFWAARADKRYATLMGIDDVHKLPPITVPKRDMRGWAVLRPATALNPSPDLLRLL